MTKQRVTIGLAIMGCLAMMWAWPAWGAEDPKDAKQSIQLFVTGFSVAKPVGESHVESQDNVLPSGTNVYFRHVMPAGLRLVKFVQGDCKLTEFVDSTGKNLAKSKRFYRPPGFRVRMHRKDGVVKAGVSLNSYHVPAKTATSITAEGSVVAMVATGLKEVTAKDVALEKGTVFSLGDLQLKVTRMGETKNWAKEKVFRVTFETTGHADIIEGVSMTKPDGQKIKCWRGRVYTMRRGTSTPTAVAFDLEEAVDSVTIKANMYQGVKTLTCPVKFTLSVGL